MKKILYCSLISLFLSHILYCQNNGDELAENSGSRFELLPSSSTDATFETKFEINSNDAVRLRLIADSRLYSLPDANSEMAESVIPEGTLIPGYRYFPKEAMWAVKYDHQWGFLPVTEVVSVNEIGCDPGNFPCDEPPVMLTDLKPVYPTEALINGITGTVVVNVLVSKTGAVLETRVIRDIRGLTDAALAGINQLKFKPGIFMNRPVNSWIEIPVTFEMNR